MRLLLIVLSAFPIACASKPTKAPPSNTPSAGGPAGKVTREENRPPMLEFTGVLHSGPASAEGAIITNEAVSACLREGVDAKNFKFQVHLKGKLNGKGALTSPRAEGGERGLRECLVKALKAISFENGVSDPVHFEITRGGLPSKAAKPFAVEWKGPKKME